MLSPILPDAVASHVPLLKLHPIQDSCARRIGVVSMGDFITDVAAGLIITFVAIPG